MSTCVQAVQQSDGSYILLLDPSVSDVSTCSYVLQSGAEIGQSIFSMSAEDGASVSASIIAVWAAAWGIRQIINMVKGASNE